MQTQPLNTLYRLVRTIFVASANLQSSDFSESRMRTLTRMIKVCGDRIDLAQGKQLHEEAHKEGLTSSPFMASALVCMYGKCGALMEAETAFRSVSWLDSVLCNAMLAAYVKLEELEKALLLFRQMNAEGIQLDVLAYASTLQACGLLVQRDSPRRVRGHSVRQLCLEIGRALHSHARKKGFGNDPMINTALTCMYAKCRSVLEAENVFSSSFRSVPSWNAMLSLYVQESQMEMCLWLYSQMEVLSIDPAHLTIVHTLQACRILAEREQDLSIQVQSSKDASLEIVLALHAVARGKGVVESAYVGTTLVSLYGKCGSITQAEKAFMEMIQPQVVSWNAMLTAYIDLGYPEKALLLYRQMLEEGVSPDERTIIAALHACGNVMKKERALNRAEASVSMIQEIGRCLHSIVRNIYGFDL